MRVSDSIQNLRVVSEIAVRAYDALVAKGLWPRSRSNRTSPLAAVALVGLGAAVGAGVALALAPSAGGALRSSLGEKLRVLGKDLLTNLGVETPVAGVDVQGEGGDEKEVVSNHAHKNGSSASRRKPAGQGASNVS